MRNSVEIKEEREALKQSTIALLEQCKKECRDVTDTEMETIVKNKEQIKALDEELRKLEEELNKPSTIEERTEVKEKVNKTMKKEFRLLEAIRDIANNRSLSADNQAIVNQGAEEMRKSGLSFGGQIQLPLESRATVQVTTAAGVHDDVIETEMFDILGPLRAKNVLVAAGARWLSGLVGDIQVPSLSATQVTWENETATAQDGAPTFSNVKLTPKRLTAYIDITKQFLVQDSLDAESLIRQDLINAITSKLESTILGSAAGTATQPQGIFYTTGTLPTITDYAGIASLEASLEDSNVFGDNVYVTSNQGKAMLRTTQKANGTNGGFIMESGEIDGTKVLNTSNVGGKNIAYGNFGELAIGQWGAIDLTIDPYTKAADGMIRIVINAFFDAKVLRPQAIKVAQLQ